MVGVGGFRDGYITVSVLTVGFYLYCWFVRLGFLFLEGFSRTTLLDFLGCWRGCEWEVGRFHVEV